MEQQCTVCFRGERGISPWAGRVEHLASLETMMQCGCGGYVFHGVYRCQACGRSFLTAHEDHWPPSSADFYIFEIPEAEAQELQQKTALCPDKENRNCTCLAHEESEHWHRSTSGVQRWFDAQDQSWE